MVLCHIRVKHEPRDRLRLDFPRHARPGPALGSPGQFPDAVRGKTAVNYSLRLRHVSAHRTQNATLEETPIHSSRSIINDLFWIKVCQLKGYVAEQNLESAAESGRSLPQWLSGGSTTPHDVLNLWSPICNNSVWGTWESGMDSFDSPPMCSY